MKRKNFLKKISFLSLTPLLLTETFTASTELISVQESTVQITDDCVSCDICISESPSKIIIENDGEYIYNIGSKAILQTRDDGKSATLDSEYFDEWKTLQDICPVEAIVEDK